MLGEAPPAFDLLYWNGDGTNLPARMAVEYLRGLCQQDRFRPRRFELFGERCAWRRQGAALRGRLRDRPHRGVDSSYDGIRKMGSRSKTFILSESGHIAGHHQPAVKKKYGHYTNGDWPDDPEHLAG